MLEALPESLLNLLVSVIRFYWKSRLIGLIMMCQT